MKGKQWIVLGLAAVVLAAGGLKFWQNWQQTHHKTQAQIIQYQEASDSALATTGERGGLFTFSFPEGTEAQAKQPGAVVILIGPEYWLESYPMQYPGVRQVRLKEQGEDAANRWLDQIVSQCAGGTPEQVSEAVDQLPGLTDGQREGLEYLARGQLGIF